MKYFPIYFTSAILFILATMFIIFNRRKKRITQIIMSCSPKIALLLELNEKIKFHQITDRFNVFKFYDNKSNYNRVDPAYIMTAEIKSDLSFFSDYIVKIKENQKKNAYYEKAVQDILTTEHSINFDELKISEKTYREYEEKLFFKLKLLPVINCSFLVTMSYSSPKGKVKLTKCDSFTFSDIYECFESISRSRFDKRTYSKLKAVERGEVSDSLRYDILNRDGFKCVICGASANHGARLHIDHIVPVSKGGKSIPSNLRTLCERCNIGKSDKLEDSSPHAENPASNDNLVCEICGGKLVLRKSVYGEFYGCSNYPNCKFTKDIKYIT